MNREALCAFILGDFTLKAQPRCSGHSLAVIYLFIDSVDKKAISL